MAKRKITTFIFTILIGTLFILPAFSYEPDRFTNESVENMPGYNYDVFNDIWTYSTSIRFRVDDLDAKIRFEIGGTSKGSYSPKAFVSLDKGSTSVAVDKCSVYANNKQYSFDNYARVDDNAYFNIGHVGRKMLYDILISNQASFILYFEDRYVYATVIMANNEAAQIKLWIASLELLKFWEVYPASKLTEFDNNHNAKIERN